MILIGQYDSPFVRRVGIALTLYGMAFQHRPWSVFADAALIAPYNPLLRVPTLVLADGTALVDSHSILDHLDGLVAPDQRLFPVHEPERHRALRIASLAAGLGDKAVSLFYERRLHQTVSAAWVARCEAQIAAVLAVLESACAQQTSAKWFGARMGHADIAVAAVLRFVVEAHPGLVRLADYPALAAHAARLEALEVFRAVSQTFVPPA